MEGTKQETFHDMAQNILRREASRKILLSFAWSNDVDHNHSSLVHDFTFDP
jgi:hypothetical protein